MKNLMKVFIFSLSLIVGNTASARIICCKDGGGPNGYGCAYQTNSYNSATKDIDTYIDCEGAGYTNCPCMYLPPPNDYVTKAEWALFRNGLDRVDKGEATGNISDGTYFCTWAATYNDDKTLKFLNINTYTK